MMQYGEFHSDVDDSKIEIRQFYPGCHHTVEMIICSEELPFYHKQANGDYICEYSSDECGGCLTVNDPPSPTLDIDLKPEDLGEFSLEDLIG